VVPSKLTVSYLAQCDDDDDDDECESHLLKSIVAIVDETIRLCWRGWLPYSCSNFIAQRLQ